MNLLAMYAVLKVLSLQKVLSNHLAELLKPEHQVVPSSLLPGMKVQADVQTRLPLQHAEQSRSKVAAVMTIHQKLPVAAMNQAVRKHVLPVVQMVVHPAVDTLQAAAAKPAQAGVITAPQVV